MAARWVNKYKHVLLLFQIWLVDKKFRLNIEASENKRLNKISLSTRNFRLKIKSCLDFRFKHYHTGTVEARAESRRPGRERTEDREQSSVGCNLIPHDRGQNLAYRSLAVYSWLRGAGHILRGTRVHVALNTLVPVSLLVVAAVVVVVIAAVVVPLERFARNRSPHLLRGRLVPRPPAGLLPPPLRPRPG